MKRIVTKNDTNGKSYIISDKIANIEDIEDKFKFFNLWITDTMPVNFSNDDPTKDNHVPTAPVKNGSVFRIVNFPPERLLLNKMDSMTSEEFLALEKRIGVKLSKYGKHPLMHTTKSIDYGIVLTGEIYLVLDKEEILLKPTDTVIQRGTSHAWSNRSDKDCLMAFVLLDGHI